MALVGSGLVAATAILAAESAAVEPYLALGRQLSDAEISQMQLELQAARLNALFLHLSTHIAVVGVATGVTAGVATAPVTGTVT